MPGLCRRAASVRTPAWPAVPFLSSVPHRCLLSRVLLTLNAQSRGVERRQPVGKGILSMVWGIFPLLTRL